MDRLPARELFRRKSLGADAAAPSHSKPGGTRFACHAIAMRRRVVSQTGWVDRPPFDERQAKRSEIPTVRERFCWYRGLLLRCLAGTREHRRSPDSVRK